MRAGLFANCIRFLPPLVISDEQLHEDSDVVEQALTEVAPRWLRRRASNWPKAVRDVHLPAQRSTANGPMRSGRSWDVIDPATEEVVRSVPFGGRDDCRRAIEAADRAFPAWARRSPYERGAILQRAAAVMRTVADEVARTIVLECGKPLVQARGEWLGCRGSVRLVRRRGKRLRAHHPVAGRHSSG